MSMSLPLGMPACEAVEPALQASPRKRAMRVGFIGFDTIGKAMASRLLKAGHQLTLYDPAREIPESLESAGGKVADSVQDACRWADAVFTMLPTDEVAEALILGPGGVAQSLPETAIHIGSSTVSIECSDRIVKAHWDAGKEYVSAPVLVGPDGTAEDLLVIAGGREATIFRIEPLLSPIGQLERLCGWPSEANIIQVSASYMGATLFQFLDRHPELCARQNRSQLARPASPLARFLGIETNGVLQ
ncbi:MAG: NAD(P)-binding domain-containing protein [Pseudomonadota bacterium]|nr:NAD(P)-binding domain-containing protein [Pseudomonadota bacterium]